MSVVLDASVALAWLFTRTDPREAEVADAALELAIAHPLVVPWLWHTAVVNALLVAERRGVVPEARVADFLARLDALPLETDPPGVAARRDAVLALARRWGLTAYDATYLELALRTAATLATFDARLARAYRDAGGTVLGEEASDHGRGP